MAVHKYKAQATTDEGTPVKKKATLVKKVSVTPKKGTDKKKQKTERKPIRVLAPLRALGGYIKGSWQELRLVHWPNRRATWGLTIAVILFSIVLGLLIFVLDLGFTYLFKNVIL